MLNAEQFRQPYGAPAIHLSSEARETIMAAVARGAPPGWSRTSTRTPARASNVVVTIGGRDPEGPPLVAMTPRSSWWQSTAERGGGLVCWLESLRAVMATPPARNVVFTANSGHELGHIGLDDFIARRPGWDRPGGATWVHYGANLGATGGKLTLLSNDETLRALTRQTPDASGSAARCGAAEHPCAERRNTRHPSRRRALRDAGG